MDTKEIQIVYRNIDELIEPDYNPRKISAKQRDDIKGFLENFGLLFLLTLSFYLLSLKTACGFYALGMWRAPKAVRTGTSTAVNDRMGVKL